MDVNSRVKVISVVGPTAVGKSALAFHLAKSLSGSVISADSMQVYKELNIGTAKPEPRCLKEIKHYLTDIKRVNEEFSAAEFTELAKEAVYDIVKTGGVPIIVGGTGLYVDSLLNGVSFKKETENKKVREELYAEFEEKGGLYLYDVLSEIDPSHAKTISPKNVRRVIRAIEVYRVTGVPISEHIKHSRETPPLFDAFKVGLNYKNRSLLYKKIDDRVDGMINDGLIEEAEAVYRRGEVSKTASQAIGYKELFSYFKGDIKKDEAIGLIKKNTRNFAKRQITWFKRDGEINWEFADETPADKLYAKVLKKAEEFLGQT